MPFDDAFLNSTGQFVANDSILIFHHATILNARLHHGLSVAALP